MASRLSWAYPITNAMLVLCAGGMALNAAFSPRTGLTRTGERVMMLLLAGALISGVLLVLVFLRWVRLQHKLQRELADQTTIAERVWRCAGAGTPSQ